MKKLMIIFSLFYGSMTFCAQPQYEYSWQAVIIKPKISPLTTLICTLKSNKTGSIYEQHIHYLRSLNPECPLYYERKKNDDGSKSSPLVFHITSSAQEALSLEKIFYRLFPFLIKFGSKKIGTLVLQEQTQKTTLFFNENELPS